MTLKIYFRYSLLWSYPVFGWKSFTLVFDCLAILVNDIIIITCISSTVLFHQLEAPTQGIECEITCCWNTTSTEVIKIQYVHIEANHKFTPTSKQYKKATFEARVAYRASADPRRQMPSFSQVYACTKKQLVWVLMSRCLSCVSYHGKLDYWRNWKRERKKIPRTLQVFQLLLVQEQVSW